LFAAFCWRIGSHDSWPIVYALFQITFYDYRFDEKWTEGECCGMVYNSISSIFSEGRKNGVKDPTSLCRDTPRRDSFLVHPETETDNDYLRTLAMEI
jgi:hypothetical protein